MDNSTVIIKPNFKKLLFFVVYDVFITALVPFIVGLINGSSLRVDRIEFALSGAIGGAIGGFIIGIVICNLALQYSYLEARNQTLSGPSHRWQRVSLSFSDVSDYMVDKTILGHYRIATRDGREILLPKIYFTKDQFEKVIEMIKINQQIQKGI